MKQRLRTHSGTITEPMQIFTEGFESGTTAEVSYEFFEGETNPRQCEYVDVTAVMLGGFDILPYLDGEAVEELEHSVLLGLNEELKAIKEIYYEA